MSAEDSSSSRNAAPDAYRLLQERLEVLGPEQLERIFSTADELREDEGVDFDTLPETSPGNTGESGFDLLPVVIAGEEWARLEQGLVQRVRTWNAFLRDIYTGQEILKAGVVPYEIVYADPNFHRGCARLPGIVPNYLQLTGFDLQQDGRGRWLVMEDHLGVAEGASYAMKKRQLLRQVAPRLFDGLEILPIEDFAAQVMDVLREEAGPSEDRVHGVLLARGSGDAHYLDHATLAREMGVSIVQGSDLIVLESRLYLKTIAGIERVDVVLRRLATSLLDPVTFDADSRYGVPGLLSCVRRGELTMANGLGSDLANNRALGAYLPDIIFYYTGERPLLGSPQVLELGDLDVREQVADNRDAYLIRHTWKRGCEWTPRQMSEESCRQLWQEIERAPSEYVARRLAAPMTQPGWTAAGPRSAPVTLRAFGLGQNRISPCALAWTGNPSSLTEIISHGLDAIKDVWILRHASPSVHAMRAQAEEAPKRLHLTSRVAESLFWMGRYAERAEVTARALRIVQMQPWPTTESALARERQPLWSAMAALSGHPTGFFVDPEEDDIPVPAAHNVPHYFLLDAEHGSSVLSSLLACRENAETIREHLPPEVWSVLNRLYLQVAVDSEEANTERVRHALEDRSLHQEIVAQLDELTGALEKHMLHNDAWHFWQLGVSAERGYRTILALEQVLAPEPTEAVAAAPASSTNLDLLLQMLAGQYAYRSLYHARPVAARVARLLLLDEVFPRSALFCLEAMRRAIAATLGRDSAKGTETPLIHCGHAILELNQLDIETYFPRTQRPGSPLPADGELSDVPTPEFHGKLEKLIDLLLEFNVLISDHYLDHQGVIREPELFDLGLSR
jgi:uncharacterized circularly permuted ATP-grasp superfamily protein/uncharacterized alpha-E superfamily protein